MDQGCGSQKETAAEERSAGEGSAGEYSAEQGRAANL